MAMEEQDDRSSEEEEGEFDLEAELVSALSELRKVSSGNANILKEKLRI
jgi:hypothetical protein